MLGMPLVREAATESRPSRPASVRWIAGAVITVVCSVVTLGLGRQIWPAAAGAAQPPAALMPFFIGLSVVESILFGLGVCFIVFGYRRVAAAGQPLWLSYGTYLAVAWMMVSWWPHDNLHRVTVAGDWTGLLTIDYAFHITLMVSIGIVAIFVYRMLLRPTGR